MAKEESDIQLIDLDKLLFDPENPRFAHLHEGAGQAELAKILWNEMFLEELILSIAVNGYYPQEPLLVTPNEKQAGTYIVVEGNRRLASLKILTDPKLAKAVKANNLPPLDDDKRSKLSKIPSLVYPSRDDLWSYLSFRHVNGPRGWSSISKAEFVANLYLKKHIPFEDILNSTGDRNKTSVKLFNGLMVLRQGEDKTRFEREDFNASSFNFSHLYTIIQYPNTKKYLGIPDADSSKPFEENPIPENKLSELHELLVWIFGSKSEKKLPVVKSQNPDLRHLDDVLKSSAALIVLREEDSLNLAHEYTDEEDRRLKDSVTKAYLAMQKARGIADSFKGDEEILNQLKKIQDYAAEILKRATDQSDSEK